MPLARPFALAALAAAVAFPALAQGDGAEAYDALCASCHESAERLAAGLPEDAAERTAALEELLPEHYAPEEESRAAIIAYLGEF